MAKKFEAPQNAFTSMIQSAADQTQQPAKKAEYYRFCIRFPIEYKDYLQEMAWRNRTDITQYLNSLVKADMDAHPEWKDTIDVLNTGRK